MRTLSQINDRLPIVSGSRTFGRRPLSSYAGHLTAIVLFKHLETDGMLSVSDSGDHIDACLIPKALLSLDQKDRGRFLVATMSAVHARQYGLSTYRIFDWDAYSPEERLQLKDAVETAARARKRLGGLITPMNRCAGRDAFA